jgi:hypothetical protein
LDLAGLTDPSVLTDFTDLTDVFFTNVFFTLADVMDLTDVMDLADVLFTHVFFTDLTVVLQDNGGRRSSWRHASIQDLDQILLDKLLRGFKKIANRFSSRRHNPNL